METYLTYLKNNQSGNHAPITTLDRCDAHLYLNNTPTVNLNINTYTANHDKYDIPADQYLETTLTLTHYNHSEEKTISTVLTPVNENIHFTYNTAEKLILNGDGLMIAGMKWLAEQTLNEENYPAGHPLTEQLTKTLTLIQLHYRVYISNYKNFYTQTDIKQRIPLALTRLNMERKLFLDAHGKHTVKDIIKTENIPEAWFQQLNL